MNPIPEQRPLSTAQICDGARRIGVSVEHGPKSIRPAHNTHAVLGPALPVIHSGSVDVILEAILGARAGDVLVIDDHGRTDQASFGDLVALEATHVGIAGVIINGAHRDTTQVIEIGLPTFSLGAHPAGPTTVEPRAANPFAKCALGTTTIHPGDVIAADADGIVIIRKTDVAQVLDAADTIRTLEHEQVERFHAGQPLHIQFEFDRYLAALVNNPDYDFATHLRRLNRTLE